MIYGHVRCYGPGALGLDEIFVSASRLFVLSYSLSVKTSEIFEPASVLYGRRSDRDMLLPVLKTSDFDFSAARYFRHFHENSFTNLDHV